MSLERAKNYLKQYQLDQQILVFDGSSATVEEAANQLQCKPSSIVKTLAFFINQKPIVILMAGNVKCDNTKFRNTFHEKAKMIPYQEVEPLIGHSPGGVCPFGIKEDVSVYFDKSIKQNTKIYPACGSDNSAIGLTYQQLEEILPNHEWIEVSKS